MTESPGCNDAEYSNVYGHPTQHAYARTSKAPDEVDLFNAKYFAEVDTPTASDCTDDCHLLIVTYEYVDAALTETVAMSAPHNTP